jgi:hypothetical protein
MARFLFLAHTNVVDGKETEFNRWYDAEHIPDVLRTPGFVAAQRFRASDHQMRADHVEHRYLTVYEIEAASLDEAISAFGKQAASGGIRMSDSVDAAGARMVFYEPVTERVTGE